MRSLRTETIRDRDGLAALAPAWWDLWSECGRATPFQSPAWLIPWWDAFVPGALRVVTVYSGPQLVALALLYREDETSRLLLIGIAASDYLDVLADPQEPDALPRLIEAAAAMDDWEEWEFPDLPAGAAALQLPTPADCRDDVHAGSPCPVLRLPADLSGLRDVLPYRQRRALQMDRNRAARRGPVLIHDGGDVAGTLHLLGELMRLHQTRWHQKGEAGMFADSRVAAFHAKALPALLAAGLARLQALSIGGRLAAVLYQLADRENRYAYVAGFEPDFAYESPGAVLFGHLIEQAVRDGVRDFHFLRGDEPYKFRWGAVVRHNTRRVFRRSPA